MLMSRALSQGVIITSHMLSSYFSSASLHIVREGQPDARHAHRMITKLLEVHEVRPRETKEPPLRLATALPSTLPVVAPPVLAQYEIYL
jgi:hypothetical protein